MSASPEAKADSLTGFQTTAGNAVSAAPSALSIARPLAGFGCYRASPARRIARARNCSPVEAAATRRDYWRRAKCRRLVVSFADEKKKEKMFQDFPFQKFPYTPSLEWRIMKTARCPAHVAVMKPSRRALRHWSAQEPESLFPTCQGDACDPGGICYFHSMWRPLGSRENLSAS